MGSASVAAAGLDGAAADMAEGLLASRGSEKGPDWEAVARADAGSAAVSKEDAEPAAAEPRGWATAAWAAGDAAGSTAVSGEALGAVAAARVDADWAVV